MRNVLLLIVAFVAFANAQLFYDKHGECRGTYKDSLDHATLVKFAEKIRGPILVKKSVEGVKPTKSLKKIKRTLNVSRDTLDKENWLEVEKNEIVKICVDKPVVAWETSLKTSVINLVHKYEQNGETININDMAKSFQDVAIGQILDRVKKACGLYEVKEVILAGGVSANSYLRNEMTKLMESLKIKLVIPPIWCTTDNAAMIAKVGEKLYERKVFAPLTVSVDPNWEIQDYMKF